MPDDKELMATISKYSSQLMQDSRDGNNLATLALTHYHKYQATHSADSRKGLVETLNSWLETQ